MKPLEETARAAADEINISYEEPCTIIARHFHQRESERDAEIEGVAERLDRMKPSQLWDGAARLVRELKGGKE